VDFGVGALFSSAFHAPSCCQLLSALLVSVVCLFPTDIHSVFDIVDVPLVFG